MTKGLSCQATGMTTTRNYYSNRDCLGRFVRRVHVDALRAEGGWVNADDHTTHAHTSCGDLRGRAWTVGVRAEGWLCTSCIYVPASAVLEIRWARRNEAPTGFAKVCDSCGDTLSAQKFPTYVDMGYRLRGDTCRRCQQTGRVLGRVAA